MLEPFHELVENDTICPSSSLLDSVPIQWVQLCASTKVQVGKDQEKTQSEKDSHSKNRGGKNQTNNQVLIP